MKLLSSKNESQGLEYFNLVAISQNTKCDNSVGFVKPGHNYNYTCVGMYVRTYN